MARFKDAAGREWDIVIPGFGAIRRLRQETGVDLNKIGHDTNSLVEVLLGDAEVTIGAVWWLVKGQRPDVDEAGFLEAVDAAALDAAKTGLIDAVFDFFHHGQAAAVKGRFQKALKSMTPSGSNEPAGSSPASAESALKTSP